MSWPGFRRWWENLGHGGATTLLIALLLGSLSLGLPVIWRLRRVLARARERDTLPADCIVVFGRQLKGEQPTAVFLERLREAERCYCAGIAPQILVAGGRTAGSLRSEAEVGREVLVSWGIPPTAILLESGSRHTLENLFEVRAIFRNRGWRRLLLVSDPLHLARIEAFARGLRLPCGLRGASSCPPQPGSLGWWLRAYREAFLIFWYEVGVAYSRLIGSETMLRRVT